MTTELELAPDAGAPARARAALEPLVADFAGDAGFRARLAVTELVTNGVRHVAFQPGETIAVRLARSAATIRVEVRDPRGGDLPRSRPQPGPDATSGRGLLIVDAVVDRWGTDPSGCIWFEIDRPTPPPLPEDPVATEAGDEALGV